MPRLHRQRLPPPLLLPHQPLLPLHCAPAASGACPRASRQLRCRRHWQPPPARLVLLLLLLLPR
jgi:hypothetical protein